MRISLKPYSEFDNRQEYVKYLHEMAGISTPRFDLQVSDDSVHDLNQGFCELRNQAKDKLAKLAKEYEQSVRDSKRRHFQPTLRAGCSIHTQNTPWG